MTKKGRKPILTETEAKEIVNSYVLKHSVSKELQYIDLHKYCIELYQNQEIPKLPSESFWRKKDRAGRKLIDEVNTALSHKLEKHEKDNELQNLLILIDNKIQNMELKITLFNELKSKQSKVEQLEQEHNIKKEIIISLKNSPKYLQLLNTQHQELISLVFHYFLEKSSQDKLAVFDSHLMYIFSTPLDYLTLLREENTQNQNTI